MVINIIYDEFFFLCKMKTGKFELCESVIGKWDWSRGNFQASCSRTDVVFFVSINHNKLHRFEFKVFSGFVFLAESHLFAYAKKLVWTFHFISHYIFKIGEDTTSFFEHCCLVTFFVILSLFALSMYWQILSNEKFKCISFF